MVLKGWFAASVNVVATATQMRWFPRRRSASDARHRSILRNVRRIYVLFIHCCLQRTDHIRSVEEPMAQKLWRQINNRSCEVFDYGKPLYDPFTLGYFRRQFSHFPDNHRGSLQQSPCFKRR